MSRGGFGRLTPLLALMRNARDTPVHPDRRPPRSRQSLHKLCPRGGEARKQIADEQEQPTTAWPKGDCSCRFASSVPSAASGTSSRMSVPAARPSAASAVPISWCPGRPSPRNRSRHATQPIEVHTRDRRDGTSGRSRWRANSGSVGVCNAKPSRSVIARPIASGEVAPRCRRAIADDARSPARAAVSATTERCAAGPSTAGDAGLQWSATPC